MISSILPLDFAFFSFFGDVMDRVWIRGVRSDQMTLLACLQSFRWFSSFSLLGPIRLPSFFLGREAEASQHPPRFPTAHPSSCTQVSRFKKWHILHPVIFSSLVFHHSKKLLLFLIPCGTPSHSDKGLPKRFSVSLIS
jgi:hypothetical protein